MKGWVVMYLKADFFLFFLFIYLFFFFLQMIYCIHEGPPSLKSNRKPEPKIIDNK